MNADFESGCANWLPPDDPTILTLTTSTEAHSGAKSCRVCLNANSGTYVYQNVVLPVTVGQVIAAEIYARGTQANPPVGNISFATSYTPQGQNDIDSPYANAIPPPGQWIRMSIVEDVYEDAPAIGVFLVFDGNQNKCVMLDDATLSILQ